MLCHPAEGHRRREPLYPTVSHKHFQEEISPTIWPERGQGVRRAGGARGVPGVVLRWEGQDGLGLQGAPKGQTLAALREPFSSTGAWKCSACSRRAASACRAPPPKRYLLSETAKPEPISSACPPGRGGNPQFRPPEQIPPAPTPRVANQSRTPGLEHKCNRFYFRSFGCWLSAGWQWVGSSSSRGAVLTVLGSQHVAHGAQELVQGSVDLRGQDRGVVDGHHHQEALAQQLKGRRKWLAKGVRRGGGQGGAGGEPGWSPLPRRSL